MARWQLKAKHYLQVPGTEWEYSETSRTTGKPQRARFTVPMYLDPDDSGQWTEVVSGPDGRPIDGFINVSDGNGSQPRDIIFTGPPTPDMLPLDDEATELSRLESGKWIHPIESLAPNYGEALITKLQSQFATANVQSGVSQESFSALQMQVAELMKQNSMLIEKLGSRRA